MSTTMNTSNMLTDIKNLINEHEYLTDLCKEQAGKIEELKQFIKKADEEQISKHLEDEIQRVGAVLNEAEKPSLFETTARTKTFTLNQEIAEHLKELGEMTSDFYKTATYERAADIIATLPYVVQNGESLLKIDGIGKGIASKVDLFLTEFFEDSESVASNDPESDDEDEESDTDDEDYFVSHNEELTEALDSLAYFEEDPHKAAAYDNAAYAVQHLPFKITSGDELVKGPKKVKGIGKSIAKKIDDFLAPRKKISVELESNPVSTNEEIAWNLEVLASLEAEDHGSQDPHKIRAYRNAAEAIRGLDFEVTNGADISQGPRKVKGIGKSIAAKIDELIVTGKIQRIRDLSE